MAIDSRRGTALILLGLLSVYLGLGMVVPIMAPLIREVGLAPFRVGPILVSVELQGGLIFAVEYLLWVVFSPLWGRWSDAWGRKPVLVLGIVGHVVGHALFAVTADLGRVGILAAAVLPLLIATRGLGGALFAAAPPAAQAWVMDVTPAAGRTRAVGLIHAAGAVGTLLGPAVPALFALVQVPLTAPLYIAAAAPVIPIALLVIWLPTTSPREVIPRTWLRSWDPRVAPVLVAGFAQSTAMAAVLFTIGFAFQDRLSLDDHTTAAVTAHAMLVVGGIAAVVQVGALRFLRVTPVSLVRVGMWAMAASLVALAFADSRLAMFAAVSLLGVGFALGNPGFYATLSFAVDESEQGSVAGLGQSVTSASFIVGPLVGTGLYQVWWGAPYLAAAALTAAAGTLALAHPRFAALRRASRSRDR